MDRSSKEDAVSAAIDKYSDMIRRICFLYLKNSEDVEDVFQEVFLKFFLNTDSFQSEEHEKAWLCRVAFNKCKDMTKSFWRKRIVSIEDMELPYQCLEQDELISEVLKLPAEYKQIIYLHFYEGRPIPEIAAIMQKNTNTVYTGLRRAKAMLKKKVGEFDG